MIIKLKEYTKGNKTISSFPVMHIIKDRVYIPKDIFGTFEVVYEGKIQY